MHEGEEHNTTVRKKTRTSFKTKMSFLSFFSCKMAKNLSFNGQGTKNLLLFDSWPD